jgi:hypothetical protein
MITATANSITFPCEMNVLNSLISAMLFFFDE